VIGRVFDHELLTRLADHGDANLRVALEKLIDAELSLSTRQAAGRHLHFRSDRTGLL